MRIRIFAGMLLLGFVVALASGAGAQMSLVVSGPASANAQDAMPLREIDDPSSGDRWLLFGSVNGGPGRLVLVNAPLSGASVQSTRVPPPAVIHAGDPVVLEEHTAVVDAHLDAIALGRAAPGGKLQVRLTIGGHVLSAIALEPGRVALAPEAIEP